MGTTPAASPAKSKDKKLKEIDRAKNEQTYWYFKLAFTTGMRLKEINTLKWNQVIAPVHETDLSKKIKRSIYPRRPRPLEKDDYI